MWFVPMWLWGIGGVWVGGGVCWLRLAGEPFGWAGWRRVLGAGVPGGRGSARDAPPGWAGRGKALWSGVDRCLGPYQGVADGEFDTGQPCPGLAVAGEQRRVEVVGR